jgi:hypothetical protein
MAGRDPAVTFAAGRFLDSGPRTFHEFIEHIAASHVRVATFTFSAGVNVNTPAERDIAETEIRRWNGPPSTAGSPARRVSL